MVIHLVKQLPTYNVDRNLNERLGDVSQIVLVSCNIVFYVSPIVAIHFVKHNAMNHNRLTFHGYILFSKITYK